MKNFIKIIGIIALVAIIGLTIVACGGGGGKLSGTFEIDDNPGYTRTFSGNKHTFEGPGFTSEGTFTTSGDELTITASDGDVTVFKFKLEGKTLSLSNSGQSWQTLTKK